MFHRCQRQSAVNSANNKMSDGNLGACDICARTDGTSTWPAPRCKHMIQRSRVTDTTVTVCACNFSDRAALLATGDY